jgi:hypothetical protein
VVQDLEAINNYFALQGVEKWQDLPKISKLAALQLPTDLIIMQPRSKGPA